MSLPTSAYWYRFGLAAEPPGGQQREIFNTFAIARPQFNNYAGTVCVSMLNVFNWFDLLPASSVAAGSDKYTTLIGSNTPVATQSATGGLTLTTGGTNTNIAGVAGVAATGFAVPLTATNFVIFRSRVNIPSLATMYVSMGLATAVTAITPILGGSADGAQFLADPTNSLVASTGATTAQSLNWILVTTVNGTSTYIFTGIPIVALQDTVLDIVINPNLTYNYYINGVLAGTSVTPGTLNAALRVIGGVETLATATAAVTIRFIQLERQIG